MKKIIPINTAANEVAFTITTRYGAMAASNVQFGG